MVIWKLDSLILSSTGSAGQFYLVFGFWKSKSVEKCRTVCVLASSRVREMQ